MESIEKSGYSEQNPPRQLLLLHARLMALGLILTFISPLAAQDPLLGDLESTRDFQAYRLSTGEEGAKRPEMLVTKAPWLETSFGIGFNSSAHVNQGTAALANESEFEFEFAYAFNNAWGIVGEAPLIIRNPVSEENAEGIGDLGIGVRYVLFGRETTSNGMRGVPTPFVRATIDKDRGGGFYGRDIGDSNPLILTLGLDVTTPTGNAALDLGEGHTIVTPLVLTRLLLNGDGSSSLFGQFGLELPQQSGVPNAFTFNVAVSHTFDETESNSFFRYVTPLIEVNGITGRGETVVNLTPGVRWVWSDYGVLGVGYSFPVTGDEEFDSQFIFSFVRDIPNRRAEVIRQMANSY